MIIDKKTSLLLLLINPIVSFVFSIGFCVNYCSRLLFNFISNFYNFVLLLFLSNYLVKNFIINIKERAETYSSIKETRGKKRYPINK